MPVEHVGEPVKKRKSCPNGQSAVLGKKGGTADAGKGK